MAKYDIHGNQYEVADEIQGDDLTTTLTDLVAHSQDRNIKKFLYALSKAEGADYDTIVGGKQKITDFSRHPQIIGLRTKEGPSTAAGKYQITGTTFKEFAVKAGVSDFTPESQDKVALKIIEQEGALEDIRTGNFRGAVEKLGGRWASLPSSKYSQPTRTMEWFEKQLGVKPTESAPLDAPPAPPAGAPKGYGPVPKTVDPAKLDKSADWVRASKQLYNLRERKGFEGNDTEAAEWGKNLLGYFNSNMVDMGRYAHDVITNGTAEDKEAFLFLMDTYDNTEWSWEGAGRAAMGMVTDPTNVIGLGTLGVGSVGKMVASGAAKQGLKKALLVSLGRTGVIAGVEGGIMGAADSTIRQKVEVSGGRRDGVSLLGVAGSTAVGATAGVVLGTAGDAALSAIIGLVRKAKPGVAPAATNGANPSTPAEAPGSPVVPPAAASPGNPSQVVPGAPVEAPINPTSVTPETIAAKVEADAVPPPVILTADEIAAATSREQQGRLWVDDLPPVTPADADAAAKIDIPNDGNAGMRSTPITWDTVGKDGETVAAQLRGLDDKELHGVLESLRQTVTVQDAPAVFKGVQILHNEMRLERAVLGKQLEGATAEKAAEIVAKLDALDARMTPVKLADDASGSISGSLLNQRKQGIPIPEDFNIESLMNQGMSRVDAEAEYARVVDGLLQTAEAQKVAKTWDDQIAAALADGNTDEAAKLTTMKHREVAGLIEAEMPGSSTLMAKATEVAISNVFSPTTVAINLVPATAKTLMLPLVRALVSDPFKAATRRELVANYSAMRATLGGAWRAAKAAFKYEQAILTRDGNRSLEGEMAIKGRLGGAIRTIPRILNASDEFLGQLNYASYVSGHAAARAVEEGAAKGATGRLLDAYVKNAVEIAMKEAFTQPSGDALIQPIVAKGMNRGLTGDALRTFVEREIKNGTDQLRHGSDQEALDFVRDVLYKRKFAGQGAASNVARSTETFINRHPGLRLLSGQLFFRTPIRVFEEGIRLTPGLQIIAPGFMKDLAGANGVQRQVRAQGEAMASLAITGAIITLYGAGSIRGDGAYDNWKAGRTSGDGPGQPAYTLQMGDGSTWSYRNFDPVATPFKIIINGLERMDKLAIRQAQGEDITSDMFGAAMAYVTVGTGAIASALRDANLATGVDGLMKLKENLADPEGKEDAWLKFFGEKLNLLVPNTMHKIAKDNDPTLKDPATFWQVVETRLAALGTAKLDNEIKTSYSYDALGNVRRLADTGTLWNIFSTASQEERARGMSEESQRVMLELDRLQQQTGAVFTALQPKHRLTGDLDLRTVLTSDGQETLFDRWQRNFKDLGPEAAVLPLLESGLPEGTFKTKGEKGAAVQKTLRDLSDAAFSQMLGEEQALIDRMIDEEVGKAKAKSGQLDWLVRDK